MGFFGNHAANQGKHTITTVIAEGSAVNGYSRINGDMQIDGEFDGELDCRSTVIISCSGRVSAKVNADKVIVNGLFDGEISANTVEVLAQGKVQGIVHTDNLCIERGGSFLGETHPAINTQHHLLLGEEQHTVPTQHAMLTNSK